MTIEQPHCNLMIVATIMVGSRLRNVHNVTSACIALVDPTNHLPPIAALMRNTETYYALEVGVLGFDGSVRVTHNALAKKLDAVKVMILGDEHLPFLPVRRIRYVLISLWRVEEMGHATVVYFMVPTP